MKYLSYEGLAHLKLLIKNALSGKVDKETGKGLSTNDFTNELKNTYDNVVTKVDELTTTGGEPNIIETVKVNGTIQTVTDKVVDIAVPTKISELTNDDNTVKDASYVHTDNNYTTEEKNKLAGLENYDDTDIKNQIAAAGKIDTITVNGTAQEVTDKTVALTIPTDNAQLTNGAGYLTEQTQANWAQNDSTQPDYIKNRFGGYEELSYETSAVLESTTCEFEEVTGQPYNYKHTFSSSIDLSDSILGETIEVIWDGVPYVCESISMGQFYGNGNLSPNGGSNNNEPFMLYVASAGKSYIATNESGSHTVAINLVTGDIVSTVVVIPEKYLPDTLALKTEIPTNNNQLTNGAGYQTAADVNAIVEAVVGAAPDALNTLDELAAALGDDANFAATVTTELSKKANTSDLVAITNTEIDTVWES